MLGSFPLFVGDFISGQPKAEINLPSTTSSCLTWMADERRQSWTV
jgi:hypothetical protein